MFFNNAAWGALPDGKHILKECHHVGKSVGPSFKGKPSLLGWCMGCHHLWDGLLCCQASQEGGAQHSGRAHGCRVGWTDFIFTGHTTLSYRSTSTAFDSSLLKWRWQQPRSPRGTPMIKSDNTWKNLGTMASTQHVLKETSGQNQTLAYVREDLYHWAVLPALATQLIVKKILKLPLHHLPLTYKVSRVDIHNTSIKIQRE